jgi:hypothetical protein
LALHLEHDRVVRSGVAVLLQQGWGSGQLFRQSGCGQVSVGIGSPRCGLLVGVLTGGGELDRGVFGLLQQQPGLSC